MNTQEHQNLVTHVHAEHPRMLFFLVSIVFFVAVAMASRGGDMWSLFFVFLLPLALIALSWVRSVMAILLILWTTLAGLHVGSSTYERHREGPRSISDISWWFWAKLSITGTVDKKLYRNELTQAYRLQIDKIANTSTWSGEVVDLWETYILISVPENLTLGVWDTITLAGKVQPLFSWSIDGFEKYSLFHNLSGKMLVPSFRIVSHNTPWLFQRVSDWTQAHIFRGFPRDSAWVILGMTIGRVELMSQAIQESFRTSGISHILVVSGSNITFLILLISGMIRYFAIRRSYRISLIILFVLLYSTLVWWDVPVIRSTIMGLVAFFAIEYRSRISSLAILFLIGDVFLIFSPLSLLYDPAFWLSFTATMSIILFYRPLLSWLWRYRVPHLFATVIALTASASLWTLPVTIYHFSTVSFWFFFANIAIAFLVGWILFASVWYILLWFVGETFLYILGLLVYIPVSMIISVAEFFGDWWVWEVPQDIWFGIIVVYFAFLMSEVIRLDRVDPSLSRRTHDHSEHHQKT